MNRPVCSNGPLNGSVRVDDPCWNPKLDTFYRVTLNDTLDKLEKDGAIKNYDRVTAGEQGTQRRLRFGGGHPGHLRSGTVRDVLWLNENVHRGECGLRAGAHTLPA